MIFSPPNITMSTDSIQIDGHTRKLPQVSNKLETLMLPYN